jgi:hypothetical protein
VPSKNLLANKKSFVPDVTIHLIAARQVFAVLCDREFNHASGFGEMCTKGDTTSEPNYSVLRSVDSTTVFKMRQMDPRPVDGWIRVDTWRDSQILAVMILKPVSTGICNAMSS